MATIELRGRINDDGELEVNLPEGLPHGEVEVTIKLPDQPEKAWEDRLWTEAEIQEAMKFGQATTGADIAARLDETSGWWERQGINDPVAWVNEVRRKERERGT